MSNNTKIISMSRQWGKSSLNDLFRQAYVGKDKADLTAEEWAVHNDVTAEDLKLYPNAAIGMSPLMQTLTEGQEKRDMTGDRLRGLYNGGVLSTLVAPKPSYHSTIMNIGEPSDKKKK